MKNFIFFELWLEANGGGEAGGTTANDADVDLVFISRPHVLVCYYLFPPTNINMSHLFVDLDQPEMSF